jgi:UDP-glucose 4-epimerase
MQNVLITGGAGFIGSNLANSLIKKKFNVTIVDNLSTGHKFLVNKKCSFFKVNLKNKKKIEEIFCKKNISTVFHFAASLNIRESQKNPKKYKLNNVTNTKILVKICKKYKVKNFIFSSTCSIYGSSQKKKSEGSKKNPLSIYAKTKLSAEKIIKQIFFRTSTKYAILRYYNVVGSNLEDKIGELSNCDHIFKNYSRATIQPHPQYIIYGKDYDTFDGTCVRDYIHIKDLNNIHLKTLKYLCNKKKNLIMNCGNGKGYSVFQIYSAFNNLNKESLLIIKKKRPGDPAIAVANIDKLKKKIRFNLKYSKLNVMINDSIAWEKHLKNKKFFSY